MSSWRVLWIAAWAACCLGACEVGDAGEDESILEESLDGEAGYYYWVPPAIGYIHLGSRCDVRDAEDPSSSVICWCNRQINGYAAWDGGCGGTLFPCQIEESYWTPSGVCEVFENGYYNGAACDESCWEQTTWQCWENTERRECLTGF